MTRASLAFGTALCALTLTVGCGGSDDGGGATSLNWFVQIQPGGSFQEVAKRCSEESDGRYEIEFELLPTDASQAREQLVRRLGAEDSTIDVIGMDVVWTAEFANAGWLREWTGDPARQVTKGVFDSVIETARFEDKLYGAPFNSNTQLLWYRTDEVRKPPATWDEMIDQAEEIGPSGGLIQVQSNQYEGFTAWFNALLESAGGQILSGPETVDLPEGPTDEALEVMGRLGNSPVAAPDIDTSNEDTARLGFEAGDSAFMVNYTFAYASAQENAPDVAKNMGFAPYPRVVANEPSRPPLGGFNLGVSAYSDNPDLAFEAAACMSGPESQLTATELDGLPPSNETLYTDKVVEKAYPGFARLVQRSIDDSGPRPQTAAYQDVSLAIQRSLHPPSKIDPEDVTPIYDELLSNLEDAAKREGLL
ncbi:MAG: extracellular solute-binding protein [Microbacterium sp.]|uniref:extracellular solute-binding protein n=1 Tax=Microbacterium sp. TaxID=51671 RepID=UPI003D6DBB17